MKLPLRIGLPLLGLMLIGLGVTEGRERLLLLVAAIGVALWSAFSLPHPGPREPAPTLLERGRREAAAAAGEPGDAATKAGAAESVGQSPEVAPQDEDFPTNGSGGDRTLN